MYMATKLHCRMSFRCEKLSSLNFNLSMIDDIFIKCLFSSFTIFKVHSTERPSKVLIVLGKHACLVCCKLYIVFKFLQRSIICDCFKCPTSILSLRPCLNIESPKRSPLSFFLGDSTISSLSGIMIGVCWFGISFTSSEVWCSVDVLLHDHLDGVLLCSTDGCTVFFVLVWNSFIVSYIEFNRLYNEFDNVSISSCTSAVLSKSSSIFGLVE